MCREWGGVALWTVTAKQTAAGCIAPQLQRGERRMFNKNFSGRNRRTRAMTPTLPDEPTAHRSHARRSHHPATPYHPNHSLSSLDPTHLSLSLSVSGSSHVTSLNPRAIQKRVSLKCSES